MNHTRLVVGEVSCVDNDISVLLSDVTDGHLKLDTTQHGCDLIVSCGDMAIKGSCHVNQKRKFITKISPGGARVTETTQL